VFASRSAAGRILARALRTRLAGTRALCLAIAPGGVPVAAQISAALHLPLDVVIIRDLDVALLVEDCPVELDRARLGDLELADDELGCVVEQTRDRLLHDALVLRGHRPFPPVWDRTVLLVDDGRSSPRVLDAVVRLVRAFGASRVILAAPVAAMTLLDGVAGVVDDFFFLETQDGTTPEYVEDTPLRDVDLVVQLERARLAACVQ
jgi:predicted phosphoribosyltransferase